MSTRHPLRSHSVHTASTVSTATLCVHTASLCVHTVSTVSTQQPPSFHIMIPSICVQYFFHLVLTSRNKHEARRISNRVTLKRINSGLSVVSVHTMQRTRPQACWMSSITTHRHTRPSPSRNNYVPEGPTRGATEYIHVYAREYGSSTNANTVETDRPQYDRHAACVIAQQHSSATFVSRQINYRALQKC